MRLKTLGIALLSLFVTLAGGVAWLLSPVTRISEPGIFMVREDTYGIVASESLVKERFIRNAEVFRWLYDLFAQNRKIRSGGYRLDRTMNAWQVFEKINGKPDLAWVTTYGCVRREQVGEILASLLAWDENDLNRWDTLYLTNDTEYREGVYYPDTYLLPFDDPVEAIAGRFIDRFNEIFAPYADEALRQDISWTTVLKIASLIQREAAGPHDMPLISGIIWNRLDRGMRLEIDSTMQYTRGKLPSTSSGQVGWWGPVTLSEKRNDSPYNTYLHAGLPPTPICSPGVDAIEAVLKPDSTDCLYYLHAPDREIHCARSYSEHKENIRKYL